MMDLLDLVDVGTYLHGNNASFDAVPKVKGGQGALPGAFPHQVFLRVPRPNGQPSYCGASIIHPLLLLTAAHCFYDGLDPNGIKPIVGETNARSMVSSINGAGQHLQVHSFIIHPNYSTTDQDSDIAIVTLKDPIKFDNVTKLIRIAEENEDLPPDANVTGWGGDMNSAHLQYDLQYAEVPFNDSEKCKEVWMKTLKKVVTENMICAGGGLKDSCKGDSGGPLTCKDKETGENFLCGIVSYGLKCSELRVSLPGIYTDVRKFHGWIRKYTRTWWRYYWNLQNGIPLVGPAGNRTCGQGNFQCLTIGSCIPESFRCDGEDDCAPWDNSDEKDCPEIKCANGRFACLDGKQCVPQTFHCDGENDCGDKSDEASCPAAAAG